MSSFQLAKYWLVVHLGLAKDALHIYVALILFFGSALLLGWKLTGWKPWTLVLAAVLTGEAWDVIDALRWGYRIRLGANVHDIWNTMFWPSAIVILARTTRVFRR